MTMSRGIFFRVVRTSLFVVFISVACLVVSTACAPPDITIPRVGGQTGEAALRSIRAVRGKCAYGARWQLSRVRHDSSKGHCSGLSRQRNQHRWVDVVDTVWRRIIRRQADPDRASRGIESGRGHIPDTFHISRGHCGGQCGASGGTRFHLDSKCRTGRDSFASRRARDGSARSEQQRAGRG